MAPTTNLSLLVALGLGRAACAYRPVPIAPPSPPSRPPPPPPWASAVPADASPGAPRRTRGFGARTDDRIPTGGGGVGGGVVDRRSALVGAAAAAAAAASLASVNPAAAAAGGGGGIPEWTLEGGVRFPTLALNTVGLSAEDTERAVRLARKYGVTHVDFHPGKERDGVARYLSTGGDRSGLFLNTKIRKAPPGTSPADAADRCRSQIDDDLGALGVDYVDMLMLRDSPDCDVMRAQWSVLEDALVGGRTRSVGVINYCESALKCVLETAKVKPALNYYMLHVGMGPSAHGLRTLCDTLGVRTFAYGALGEPGPNPHLLSDPTLDRIGARHGRSAEEVAIRWVTQGGAAVSVRPTTDFGLGISACGEGRKCEEGIRRRAGSFGWKLTEEEMAELDAMTSPDDNPTLFSSAGCPGAFVMPK